VAPGSESLPLFDSNSLRSWHYHNINKKAEKCTDSKNSITIRREFEENKKRRVRTEKNITLSIVSSYHILS